LATLYDFYENAGDMVIRWLGDEPRLPAMRTQLEDGRRALRSWVAASFDPTLAKLAEPERRQTLDALIIALDVYTWKLLRRDFGRSAKAARAVTRKIIIGLTQGK